MKLFYVEHQVMVTKSFALIAEDEEDLKRVLAAREAALRAVPFSPKLQRDKKGAVVAHQLGADWTYAPHGPAWDGTSRKD